MGHSAPPPCPPAEDEEGIGKEMGKEGSGTESGSRNQTAKSSALESD